MNPIISMINAYNINSFYDPRKQNDGGGYWQPIVMAVLSLYNMPAKLAIVDNNQGAFGSMLQVYYRVDDTCSYCLNARSLQEAAEKLVQFAHPMSAYQTYMSVEDMAGLLTEVMAIGNRIARFNHAYQTKDKTPLFGKRSGFFHCDSYCFCGL